MVKKLQKTSAENKKSGAELPRAIKESAQQIWLAGLGAFAKAQEEGGKVFEALVQEGMNIQRKTQVVAEEKISDATNRMTGIASDMGSRATGQWDKLETIFEDRVAKALARLGVPTSRDLDDMRARLDALTEALAQAQAQSQAAPPVAKKAAVKTAAKNTARAATKKVARTATRTAQQQTPAEAENTSPSA